MLSNNELYAKIKEGNLLLAGPCAIESETLMMQVATPYIVKVAKAIGIDRCFMKVHFNSKEVLSGGSNMLNLESFKKLVRGLI